jgi:hypothetical protein
MKQTTFASLAWNAKGRTTRRERFLAEMNAMVPWARLTALIEPHYPKGGRGGRPSMPLERMVRIYFMQQWFNLSDPQAEDALYASSRCAALPASSWPKTPFPTKRPSFTFVTCSRNTS